MGATNSACVSHGGSDARLGCRSFSHYPQRTLRIVVDEGREHVGGGGAGPSVAFVPPSEAPRECIEPRRRAAAVKRARALCLVHGSHGTRRCAREGGSVSDSAVAASWRAKVVVDGKRKQ